MPDNPTTGPATPGGGAAAMGIGTWAGPAISTGMGLVDTFVNLALDKGRRRRDMQQAKEMMEFQQQKQLEMWEKTGYGATKEQMMKAGLNPALMYGMGGGGGSQTIGAGLPGVASQQIESKMGMGLQTGMQLALLQAQKENIEANTEKTKAETGESGTRSAINMVTKALNDVELEIKSKSKHAAIALIEETANKMASEAADAANRQDINIQTRDEQIDEIVFRSKKMIIEKELAEQQKTKTAEEINKLRTDINATMQQLENEAKRLRNEGKALENDTIRTKFETNLGNRLSIEAVRALGGLAQMYAGKKTTDVNR